MIFQNIQVSFLPCQAISQVRFQQQKYEHVFIRAVWDMSFTHCISSLLKPLLIQAKSRKLATMLKMLNIFHHKTIFCFYTGQLALKLWFHMSTICFRWETYSFLGWNKKKIYRVHSLLSSQHTNCFRFTYYAINYIFWNMVMRFKRDLSSSKKLSFIVPNRWSLWKWLFYKFLGYKLTRKCSII